MLTYDKAFQTQDEAGNFMGKKLAYPVPTKDGQTVDSTGAFLVGELERLDQVAHEPLVSVMWSRDIDLREDVTIADEVSSFTLSTYGSAGGLGTGQGIGNGKAWMGKNTTQIPGVSVDLAKTPNPLRPWALEVKYDILELESAAKLGRPIDEQKIRAVNLKHNMDIDEMVYIGDTSMAAGGLVNAAGVSVTNVPATGTGGSSLWINKTPAQILADVNTAIQSVWASSGWAVMPNRILVPPANYGYLVSTLISSAGNQSVMKFLLENNIAMSQAGQRIEILPTKWAVGAAVGGTIGIPGNDRMIVYSKQIDHVRFPMTLLQRTPLQYDGLFHKFQYYCRLGVVEVVYPETLAYYDGI